MNKAPRAVLFLLAFLAIWPAHVLGQPPVGSFLCRDGSGTFDAEFRTGVRVHVGAARGGGAATLATRACSAKLVWGNQELEVASNVAQLDLDAFGIDLAFGAPVAAFQIKRSAADCCVDYAIYSLESPPRLLKTIHGGEFFRAADTDLDGTVEIWTGDAAATDGFERLSLTEFDAAPTVVLRYSHDGLRDVSAEFLPAFDAQISARRNEMSAEALREFKNGDGRLAGSPGPDSVEKFHRLRATKIKILEVAWAYLYSGREQDAARFLAEVWPPSDFERIQGEIRRAHQAGLERLGAAASGNPKSKKRHAEVFDVRQVGPGRAADIVAPKAILLEFPQGPELPQTASPQEVLLDLVVDSAGKVRSVESAGPRKADPEEFRTAEGWRFIPAFQGGRAVACRMRIAVSPKQ